jgi:hypothetical protein
MRGNYLRNHCAGDDRLNPKHDTSNGIDARARARMFKN